MVARRLQSLLWQMPSIRPFPPPSKGLSDNPAYQWWRDPRIVQPDSWWGMAAAAGELDRPAALLNELGVDVFRFEIPWRALAPLRPGQSAYDPRAASDPEWTGYRWARLDAIVAALVEVGVAPVPVVAYAPGWAMPPSATNEAAPPERGEYVADVMKALASRYRGTVSHWELWNEPDHPHSWSGTLEQYVRLVLVPGTAAIREAAPGCSVLMGGVAHPSTMSALVDLGAVDHFDVANLHVYPKDPAPRHVRGALNQVRTALARVGRREVPVWITECGIATRRPSSDSHFGAFTDEKGQAQFIGSVFGSVAAEAIFIYQLRDTAIFDGEGRCLKEVYWGLLSRDWNRRKAGFDQYRTLPGARQSRWRQAAKRRPSPQLAR
jgi:polysaccharide biosynthesis protein PslG